MLSGKARTAGGLKKKCVASPRKGDKDESKEAVDNQSQRYAAGRSIYSVWSDQRRTDGSITESN